MTLTELLNKVNQLDIKLWVEDGRLRYNAPEGVLTDDLKTEIIKNKPEIIEFLVRANSEQKVPNQIEKASRNAKLPVSHAQKWLWLYDQVESNSFAFNIPSVVRMKGNLVIPALESSINEIIKRHEILRTVIISEGNEVYQKILPELTVTLPVEDLQTLAETEQEKKVYEYFNEQSQLSFNLETGPYLRFKLLQLKEDEYALVFTFHHSISDNWSLNIFITELAALYKAALNKEKAILPELAIQYADYAVWQQSYLKSTQAESKFNYWKERLKDIDQIPSLPTDYTRPKEQSRKSIRKFKILPVELIQKLKTLSQKEGCSLYVTLLAAYKVLLYQYTGLEDLIVGSPVAGRTRKELEGLIGFFINTVTLWTKLNSDATFKDFMKSVRKTTAEAFANQEIPFETLVEELQPKREQGKTPFFQAFFNMYSSSFELELADLKITPYSSDMIGAQNYNSKFDMALLVIEHQAGYQIDFSFSADLFADSTGNWLFQQYCKLLEVIAEDPDCKLSELPELSPKEHQIIEPKQPFTPIKREEVEQLLNVRFEKIVKQVPQHIAVESDNRSLTYEELNKRANQVGRLILQNIGQYKGLTKKERIRYTRQLLIEGWGIESQEILKNTTVFAAGAGGSGSPTIMQLALLGIGTIIICDFDKVELSNLNRQILHDESRIGMNKAESAALTVKRINPNVKVIARTEKITKDNIYELVGDAAVIFDNLDDIEAKFVLSECAVAKGIPHVISSMIERSSYAAIFHTPYTPCFHCLYDRNKLGFVRELRKDQSGWNKVSNPVASPALFASTGFACNEAIKIILGYQNVAYNKYFFFNQQASREFPNSTGYKIVTYPFSEHFKTISKKQGFDWDEGWNGRFIEEITIEKDPKCPLCGKDQPERLAEATSAKIAVAAAEAGNEETGDIAQITVGLLLEHDLEMIVGILGVLKSGNIFVTMDPTYPEDRLLYMLQDTGARIIITDNPNLEKAIKLRDKVNKHVRILNINEDYGNISDDDLPERIKPDSLSYIMYTSGSTGYPKGVMQKHRNVLHFIMNYTNGLHISSEDRLSLIPSFSFSASMMDTFAALLNGATLCLYNIRKEGPAGLGKWLIEKRITIYHSVPTVFRHFVAGITEDMSFPDLRLIDFGGEPVSRVDVELYKKHFSNDCLLVNGLGATELNVIRQYPINHQTELIGNLVPVGYPVPDTEILLIDESGREVKYNTPGEIVIKSEFLSPGYWEMEEQTGRVFKQDETTAKRLYYTGDLGRLRTDGCLEHLGRKDSQLKIRGIRIEAAEIETVLLELPFIKEAVVTAEENAQGDKQLVAYVVEQEGLTVDVNQILGHLRERLPEYMVPASFVKLESLPLTFTGKVDRRLLKAAGGESLNEKGKRFGKNTDFDDVRDSIETVIRQVWRDVLGIVQIGRLDKFYDLGGDSLKAVHVIAKLKDYGLTLEDLTKHPTISELAELASKRRSYVEPEKLPSHFEKNLEIDYFFTKNGDIDPIARNLNCNVLMLYYNMKRYIPNYIDYLHIFLNDISFGLIINSNGEIYNIDVDNFPDLNDLYHVEIIKGEGFQSIGVIEKLLDEGKLPIIKTYTKKLPFHKKFISFDCEVTETPEDLAKDMHTFIAVAYDQQMLYYVEMPYVLNSNYIPYAKNKSVGVIKKDDLQYAFNVDLYFTIIDIKTEKLNQEFDLKEKISLMIKNSSQPVQYDNENKILHGFEALDELTAICNKEYLYLNQANPCYKGYDLKGLLDWKIWNIISRREQLKKILIHYQNEYSNISKNEILKVIDATIDAWRGLLEVVFKKFEQKQYLFGKDYINSFDKIKEAEQVLIEKLSSIYHGMS